ncbi:MAG: hypothetical protein NC913_00550 [Candidatus Omnitrophica bacterium]|nr:hypothetical protein [Candidatus Omnitrophota bacterium]
MKRVVMILSTLVIFAWCGTNISAAETHKTTPTKAHILADTSVQPSEKVQKIEGTVVNVDTEKNTITIKKVDGSEITLKAIKPKIQEKIKNLKAGEKITVSCKESKREGMVLKNVIKEKPDKGKGKHGKK